MNKKTMAGESSDRPAFGHIVKSSSELQSDNRGALITSGNLIGQNLSNRDFSGARISGNLRDTNFSRCSMRLVTVVNANLNRTIFDDCDLFGATIVASPCSAYFRNASLVRSVFIGGTTAMRHRTEFTNSDLTSACLAGCDFSNSILKNAQMSKADLRYSTFTSASFDFAELSESVLIGVDLHNSSALHATFHGALFQWPREVTSRSRPRATPANLSHMNLENAILSEACLDSVNFRGANLRGTDLRGAILCFADLRDSDLTHANLDGADLRFAQLPAGFNPPPTARC